MKKRYKIIIIISLFFIVPNIPNYYKSLVCRFSSIPKEYEDYEALDNLVSNSDYNIRVFHSNVPENASKINDSLISISTWNSNENSLIKSWYKINSSGKLIDSLSIANEEIYERDSYLVNLNKNYYLTWLKNGDTLSKPFSLIEKGKFIGVNDLKKYTDSAIYSGSEYLKDSITDERYLKMVYYKNNKWYQINTNNKISYSLRTHCCIDNTIEYKNLNELLTLDYFHKTYWVGDSFPDLGIYINGRHGEWWGGTGFYHLTTNKKIKFKIEGMRFYKGDDSPSSTGWKYYQNQNDKYTVITRYTGYNSSKQFLIQYK